FDAWPVEPPGFGSGPLSRRTRSVQPSSGRCHARLFPTMPSPLTTPRAAVGHWSGSAMALIYHVGSAKSASSPSCVKPPFATSAQAAPLPHGALQVLDVRAPPLGAD